MSAISSSDRSCPGSHLAHDDRHAAARPARCAARQRRSPAMIWKRSPTRRTTIGWMTPFARIDRAELVEPASSTWVRGWKSVRLRGDRRRPRAAPTASAARARRESARSAPCRARDAFGCLHRSLSGRWPRRPVASAAALEARLAHRPARRGHAAAVMRRWPPIARAPRGRARGTPRRRGDRTS